jgi:hypothetical protein
MFKTYYENNLPIVPTDVRFRHFRFQLKNNKWINIRKQIHDAKTLQKLLCRYDVRRAYISASAFLNSSSIKHRKWHTAGYKIANNVFLYSDFVLDFDAKQFDKKDLENGINLAFTELRKVSDYLKTRFKSRQLFVRTGNGFHLWLLDWHDEVYNDKEIIWPLERENYFKQMKRGLVMDLLKHDFMFDTQISLDTRRIMRVWNSVHENGTICVSSFNINDVRDRRIAR